MTDSTIKCPKCDHAFALTDTLAAPMIERVKQDYEKKLEEQQAEVEAQHVQLKLDRETLGKEQKALERRVEEELAKKIEDVKAEQYERAQRSLKQELDKKDQDHADISDLLKNTQEKLSESQKKEAEFTAREREFEAKQRAMDLEIQKAISSGLNTEMEKFKTEQDQVRNLELREYKEREQAQLRTIEDLKRKLEQGSQQTQGEVLELELEDVLRRQFPYDNIEPVSKGVRGGDIIQHVRSPNGSDCGKILWETKRAKAWSGSWIPKIKQDQRDADADISIVMSEITPKEIDGFGEIDSVWITSFRSAIPLAQALRRSLMEVSRAKIVREGQASKAELIYDYLTGPQFKQRVQASLEMTKGLQEALTKEKRASHRNWALRQKQIDQINESMAGMHGDLMGIAGRSMLEIEEFAMPALEEE